MLGEILSIGGALIGADEQESQNDAMNAQMMRNEQLQRDFAQQGITWRVEDAKKAGIHPLFALQGGGAAYAPSPIVAMNDGVGAAISRAGQAVSSYQAQQAMLEGAAAQVEKDKAQADMFRSIAARNRQGAVQAKPAVDPITGDAAGMIVGSGGDITYQGNAGEFSVDGTQFTPYPRELQPFFDRRQVEARRITSANSMAPSETAGTSPHWDVYRLKDNGMLIQLPAGSNPSEAYESMAESKTLLGFVVARNVEKYGAKWLVEFMKGYGSLFNWD